MHMFTFSDLWLIVGGRIKFPKNKPSSSSNEDNGIIFPLENFIRHPAPLQLAIEKYMDMYI